MKRTTSFQKYPFSLNYRPLASIAKMSESKRITFDVNYDVKGSHLGTTITILEKHIECPVTPNINFKLLNQILINCSESLLGRNRNRTIGLMSNGIWFKFVAEDYEERNIILRKILDRLPTNETNQAHWITIQSATKEAVLEIDLNKRIKLVDRLKQKSQEQREKHFQKLNAKRNESKDERLEVMIQLRPTQKDLVEKLGNDMHHKESKHVQFVQDDQIQPDLEKAKWEAERKKIQKNQTAPVGATAGRVGHSSV